MFMYSLLHRLIFGALLPAEEINDVCNGEAFPALGWPIDIITVHW